MLHFNGGRMVMLKKLCLMEGALVMLEVVS